jgi:hypothetical protein
VRTRYCRLAERYPRVSLDAALVLLARMRRAEHEARAAAIATWGYSSRPRVTLMVLDELRLILRMVRRYAREAWPGLLAATLDGEGYAGPAQAAE